MTMKVSALFLLLISSCSGFSPVIPFGKQLQHGSNKHTSVSKILPPSKSSIQSAVDDLQGGVGNLAYSNSLSNFEATMKARFGDKSESQLKSLFGGPDTTWEHQVEYMTFAQGFNRRFTFKPWFVVYCESEDDVVATFNCAMDNNLAIRIRAGGHDHEAECTADNVVLIDVSRMKKVEVDKTDENNKIATIGVGSIFQDLTKELAKEGVMVAHGTCGTVCITGFTMGGGWGPYTRKVGMCCDSLVSANVILGDGNKVTVTEDSMPDLFWALRGGGGFSYGLVTELKFKTFDLPSETIRFDISWNAYQDKPHHISNKVNENVTTLEVLKRWEKSITSSETPQLMGTNLQVTGRPLDMRNNSTYDKVYNECIMYGYWDGNESSLRDFVKTWYNATVNGPEGSLSGHEGNLTINPHHGGKNPQNDYGEYLMSNWARISTAPMVRAAAKRDPDIPLTDEQRENHEQNLPLPPDDDHPAPHKITCRLADNCGLQDAGHEAYINSLWSSNILPGNRALGLHQYTTLGAIVGDHYMQHKDDGKSAFPYKDKLYTIQYQSWWNDQLKDHILPTKGQPELLNARTNRALDWMVACRDYDIPNTSGSFISFKDSSIPTETYFDKNYERLVQVKRDFCEDKLNRFSSKKTII